MQPEIHIHFPAVLAAVAAHSVIGFVWYGPLFGKLWAKLMGFPADFKPAPGQMVKSIGMTVVGSLLTAYVLAHSVEVWRPSTWKVGTDEANYTYGAMSGFFTWIGFYVPMLLGSVAWEGRGWKLFGINAAYHFVGLQAIGAILAAWRA